VINSDLAARIDRLESHRAIERLVHEYCHGADKRDPARWAAVWDADAVWAAGTDAGHQFHGLDAIATAVADQWAAFRQMHHFTANLVVDIAGERATGECDAVVYVQPPPGVGPPPEGVNGA
jgi:hypothetical protein